MTININTLLTEEITDDDLETSDIIANELQTYRRGRSAAKANAGMLNAPNKTKDFGFAKYLAEKTGIPESHYNHPLADSSEVRDALYAVPDIRGCFELYMDEIPRILAFTGIGAALLYSYPPTGFVIKSTVDKLFKTFNAGAPTQWQLAMQRFQQYKAANSTTFGAYIDALMSSATGADLSRGYGPAFKRLFSNLKSLNFMTTVKAVWGTKNIVISVGILAYVLAKAAGGLADLVEPEPGDGDVKVKLNKEDFKEEELKSDNPYYLRTIEQSLESLFFMLEVTEIALGLALLGGGDPRLADGGDSGCRPSLTEIAAGTVILAVAGYSVKRMVSGATPISDANAVKKFVDRSRTSVMLTIVDEIDDTVRMSLKNQFKFLPDVDASTAGFYDDLCMELFEANGNPDRIREILQPFVKDTKNLDSFVQELPGIRRKARDIQKLVYQKYEEGLGLAQPGIRGDIEPQLSDVKKSVAGLRNLENELLNRRALAGTGMDEPQSITDELVDFFGRPVVLGSASSEVAEGIQKNLDDLIKRFRKGEMELDEFVAEYRRFWQESLDDISGLAKFDETGKLIDSSSYYLQLKQVNQSFSRIFIKSIDDTAELADVARRAPQADKLFEVLRRISEEEKHIQGLLSKLDYGDTPMPVSARRSPTQKAEIFSSSDEALAAVKEETFAQVKGLVGGDISAEKLKEATDALSERVFLAAKGVDSAEGFSKLKVFMIVSVGAGIIMAAKLFIYDPIVSGSEVARLHKMTRDMRNQEIDAILENITEEDEEEFEAIATEIFGNPKVYGTIYRDWIFYLDQDGFINNVYTIFESLARQRADDVVISGQIIDELIKEKARFDTVEGKDGNKIVSKSSKTAYNIYNNYVTRPEKEMGKDTGGLGPGSPGYVGFDANRKRTREKEGALDNELEAANRWWPLAFRFLILNAGIEVRIHKLVNTKLYSSFADLLNSNDPEKGKKEASYRTYFKKLFMYEILRFNNSRELKNQMENGFQLPKGYKYEDNKAHIRVKMKELTTAITGKLDEKYAAGSERDGEVKFLDAIKESSFYGYRDLKNVVKSMLLENYSQGYSLYPYSSTMGAEEEPRPDYLEDWKALEVSLIRDKTRQTAINIAKILVNDLELFGDFLDYAGQNQSIGSELLKKMQQNKEKEPKV
tara:strand:- start:19705 stop:23169 length:3465 start_codon:yes stop_codon:yes gene_type:complete